MRSAAARAWWMAVGVLALAALAPSSASERTTHVVNVFPSADRVPENLLKIYVEFSAPMPEGEALTRIQLLDERGRAIDAAFLRLDAELWDPSRRRLTLLLDPGRVKRGLRANLESGAPLRAGHAVTLAIDGAWRDEVGRPLAAAVRKRWQVTAADRSSLDPRLWRIAKPVVGTRGPLSIDFGEPLDRALLARFLTIEDAQGRRLAGEAIVGSGESSWQFAPAEPWKDAEYRLAVDARLEDLAANRVSAPFDVDLAQPAPGRPQGADARHDADAVRLMFHPRHARPDTFSTRGAPGGR